MMAIQTIAESFRIGVQIAAPFIVFGLVFQLGLGVLSRLMPQIQIYFIAMPASIALGFLVLFLLIGTIMTWYLGHVEAVFGRFVAP
jgi:flagellar biosynthetic protein FliR